MATRTATLVVVTDDSGKVLARDADRNRMYVKPGRGSTRRRATLEDGDARHDVWKKDDEGKLLDFSVAASVAIKRRSPAAC